MKIIVLGADGMAGHMITSYLKENTSWEIIPWGIKDFEVTEDGSWKEKIEQLRSSTKTDYIINCIGILKVANDNPVLGMRINSLFPHELAEICSPQGIKVIHLSTDCWQDLDIFVF